MDLEAVSAVAVHATGCWLHRRMLSAPEGPCHSTAAEWGAAAGTAPGKQTQCSYQPSTRSFWYLSPEATDWDMSMREDEHSGLQEK